MIATGISLALQRSDKLDKAAQVKTAKCISLHVEIVTVSRAETVLEKVRECTAVCIRTIRRQVAPRTVVSSTIYR